MDNKQRWCKNSKKYNATEKSKNTRKLYRQKNKEKIAIQQKIRQWRYRGIISKDFDKTYKYYIDCRYCEFCDEPFKNSEDRCLDHDHTIDDDDNIRGVLCRGCNAKDVFLNYFIYIYEENL